MGWVDRRKQQQSLEDKRGTLFGTGTVFRKICEHLLRFRKKDLRLALEFVVYNGWAKEGLQQAQEQRRNQMRIKRQKKARQGKNDRSPPSKCFGNCDLSVFQKKKNAKQGMKPSTE